MKFSITLPKDKQHTKSWKRKFVLFGRVPIARNEKRYSPTDTKLVFLRRLDTRVASNGQRLWRTPSDNKTNTEIN